MLRNMLVLIKSGHTMSRIHLHLVVGPLSGGSRKRANGT